MPHRFSERFKVRHYEVDAYGHLNNAVYLKYMEETAIRASSDMGFTPQDYLSRGRIWLISASEIQYRAPVTYGDEVAVSTWVESMSSAAALRRYDFHKIGDRTLVARATTEWVFVDSGRNRPTRVWPEFATAAFPEGRPSSPYRRLRFPQPLDPPADVFRIHKQVEWRDIDPNQHLNNAAYMTYAEDCAVAATNAFGWPTEVALERGYAFFIRANRLRYLKPAYLDDELEISSWLVEVQRASVRRHYDLKRLSDGELLAQVQSVYLVVDPESRKPLRFTPEMMRDFAANISKGAIHT